eukprot:CAMPEP_0119218630 /NCGR_PEP_ID=MMETSP1327-20130426/21292_1 /TAXON_ID=38833 /ORGANISM="Micromonas pusilla, Strain RCC2306" /LENGTH=157 /DNA_ID=CAMNT_0007216667 /DNA_START=339 /DNA_END=808 /DNA_ORIENTATION=-
MSLMGFVSRSPESTALSHGNIIPASGFTFGSCIGLRVRFNGKPFVGSLEGGFGGDVFDGDVDIAPCVSPVSAVELTGFVPVSFVVLVVGGILDPSIPALVRCSEACINALALNPRVWDLDCDNHDPGADHRDDDLLTGDVCQLFLGTPRLETAASSA